MNRTIKLVLIIIIATIITGTFLFNPLVKMFFGVPNQSSIYDSDKAIASDADSYSYRNRVGKVVSDKANLSFKLTGMDTLWRLNYNEPTDITISYNIDVKSGEFKVVLVKPNKEVEVIVEGSGEDRATLTLEPGKNIIKIVGKEAEVDLDITLVK